MTFPSSGGGSTAELEEKIKVFEEQLATVNETLATVKAESGQATNHIKNKDNPHAVTKAQVGLDKVANVAQASKAEHDAQGAKVTANTSEITNLKSELSGLKTKVEALR